MSDTAKDILALIAKLIRERDNARGMHRDTLMQLSELLEENTRYEQELERRDRAMRRARRAIRNQTDRNDFDRIYSMIMGGK